MAEEQKKAVPTKEQLEHYAKKAGLVPIAMVKDFLFAGYEGATPETNDLGTLVLTHDVEVEKTVESRLKKETPSRPKNVDRGDAPPELVVRLDSGDDDDEHMQIKSAVCITTARVCRYVLAGTVTMQVGRKALQDCFSQYPEKDKKDFQENELRAFADRFKSVAEAIHQELVAMVNRAG